MPLYSKAKQFLRQTSAQPSPPEVFEAPFSKAKKSPLGSSLIGSFIPKRRQKVDEMVLGGGAFFQLDRVPFGDEFLRRHEIPLPILAGELSGPGLAGSTRFPGGIMPMRFFHGSAADGYLAIDFTSVTKGSKSYWSAARRAAM